jgi:hypothetical protein
MVCKINHRKIPSPVREKVVAEQPDEGLMVAFRARKVQLHVASTRTSSVMLRMTPSPSRRRKFVDVK